MQGSDCTAFEIEGYISSLKNKATSDLAIQPLKFVSKEIAPVIQHLVNASLIQGIFPTKLKCAKVIPLHKGGSRTDINNYRPISLLSCFSKIYEKIMHNRLTKFFDENKIIFRSQYGFRSGHSCEHALLEAQHRLNIALDKNQIAVLLLIDFSKAFDMVDHGILLSKLEHYGVRGNILSWFRSYLINRRQYVHVNNHESAVQTLQYGVPQGSILGPLLFILYINDMPQVSKLANYIFYADDANIIITADNYDDLRSNVNTVLQKINNWVINNGLKLNINKTKYMMFTNRRNIANELNISLNGKKIEYTDRERFLGVILDSNLTWSSHINLLSSKLSQNSGIIYKLKGIVPVSVLRKLYNSFIQSHLNYCSSVWGLGAKSSLNKFFTSQKKAVRAIENRFNNCFYNPDTGELPCHTKEIFARNNILTVHNLIAKNCLVLMHKVLLKASPINIVNLFSAVKENGHRRKPIYFDVPYSRLKSLDKTLRFRGPKLYNTVVNSINKELLNSKCNSDTISVEKKFLNPFKKAITKFFACTQKTGDKEWDNANFPLYTL